MAEVRGSAGAGGSRRRLPSALAGAVVVNCALAVLTALGPSGPLVGAAAAEEPGGPAVGADVGAGVGSEIGFDAASGETCGPAWATGWTAAPRSVPADPALDGATLRLVVQPQVTGSQVRVRLSNVYGPAPLVVSAVSVARVERAAAVVAATLAPVAFAGSSRITIPPGADVLSDPVRLDVEQGRALAVSLYLPAAPPVGTAHPVALQTSYLSGRGDFTGRADGGPFARRIDSWPVLTGLEVRVPRATNAVVAIGDSLTDGVGTGRDADERWSDSLTARLGAAGGPAGMTVLNAGIAGNRLLADDPARFGASPLARFDRDVAALHGVVDVVLNAGTNDIAAGRSAEQITAGLRRFAERARAAGKRVFLTTVTPSRVGAHGTPTAVATRAAVNRWVRESGPQHADGVFDFAAAVADPAAPARLRRAYDSGDGLHLTAAGYRALAGAVDIGALTGSPCLATDTAADEVLFFGR